MLTGMRDAAREPETGAQGGISDAVWNTIRDSVAAGQMIFRNWTVADEDAIKRHDG